MATFRAIGTNREPWKKTGLINLTTALSAPGAYACKLAAPTTTGNRFALDLGNIGSAELSSLVAFTFFGKDAPDEKT